MENHKHSNQLDSTQGVTFREIVLSFKNWFKYFMKHRIIFSIVLILGGAAGALFAIISPITYTSTLTFILEDRKGTGGGLSAIAGQFGLDIGGGSSGGTMLSGDNIIGLLTSRRFTTEVLLTRYGNTNFSLADKYASLNGYTDRWKGDGEVSFPFNGDTLTNKQDSLLKIMVKSILDRDIIVDRPDKKMSFFEVTLDSKDELFGKLFTERLVTSTVDFYIETKTRQQRSNVNRLQHRADSVSVLLNMQTYKSAVAQSNTLDINPVYQSAAVSAELTSRNKMMIATIYAELVKNLELQKATLTQETPVIQIVDDPSLSQKKNKKSIMLFLILGGMTAIVFTSLILIFRRLLH